MSDYTPTTEDMRQAYWHWLELTSHTEKEVTKKFDRWLAEVKAQAWEEGYTQGNNDMYEGDFPTANPYRGENK